MRSTGSSNGQVGGDSALPVQVDGALSVRCYMQALLVCFEGLWKKQEAAGSHHADSGKPTPSGCPSYWSPPAMVALSLKTIVFEESAGLHLHGRQRCLACQPACSDEGAAGSEHVKRTDCIRLARGQHATKWSTAVQVAGCG